VGNPSDHVLENEMRILVYKGKYGTDYWLADTDEQLDAAFTRLFTMLDSWGCYEEDQEHLYEAREGNIRAIRFILSVRQDYEYEEWNLEEARNPCTD
jgi:hypothetical protein